ncbi:MAG: globin [Pseudomonadota bacterium]
MSRAEIITETLEAVAEAVGDPAPLVYAHLFEAHPKFEKLFIMDIDGGVRGSMLQQALDCVMDHAEDGALARVLVPAARADHEGYGVEPADFPLFFTAMRDVFRDSLGAGWTLAMDREWTALLNELQALAKEDA